MPIVGTPGKVRVLVVDDSVLIRRLMTDVLYDDKELVIAGTADNGKIALAMITQVNPDVVTMDVEMPEMNGLDALREIRKTHPKLPVIMVSSYTDKGAAETIDALTLGANDYVQKPSKMGSLDMALEHMKEQLLPKIKALCGLSGTQTNTARRTFATASTNPPRKFSTPIIKKPVQIVVIGISTGGPNALSEMIPQFPANFPIPILIVQHMPPTFTKLLAERLAARSALKVTEAINGELIQSGHIYIAPGDYHMTILREGVQFRIKTNQNPPENSCRPSVDVLFRSAAEVYGQPVLSIVMTGMGQDGLRGAEKIKEFGGQVLAQDENSSVVWGMPGFVANSGLADKVVPLGELAGEITRRVFEGRNENTIGSPIRKSL